MSLVPRSGVLFVAFLVVASLVCAGPAMAKPPKPEYSMADYLMGNPLWDSMRFEDLWTTYTFQMNKHFWDADRWSDEATKAEQTLAEMMNAGDIKGAAGMSALAVAQRERAIREYQADNENGKNDREISQSYMALASTYTILGPTYSDWRLEELEHATQADESNANAWNERIRTLESLGRTDEAAQVKNQRDAALERSASTASSFLPLPPLVPVLAVLVVMLGYGIAARKQMTQCS